MTQEQRAAIKDAERRERIARFQALPEAQRAAVLRRANIFRSGVPACWSWPAKLPTEKDYRRHQREQLEALAVREGYSDETREKLWEFERTLPFDDDTALSLWQAGRCAVCEDTGLELVSDHDHTSGLVRGLLCRSCNTREGFSYEPGESRNVFVSYRQRPPTVILGLEIRYWDPIAKDFAPDRRGEPERDPWENAIRF
jgi:hypothetical protein